MTEKMIVACPECRTRFVAPLEKFLPSGRKVRCAKCGHSWFQQAEVQGTTGVQDPDTAEEVREKPAEPRRSVIEEMVARKEAQAVAVPPPLPVATSELPKTVPPTKHGLDETERMGAAIADSDSVSDSVVRDVPKRRRGGWLRAILYCLAAFIVAGILAYFLREPLSQRFPSLAAPLSSFSDRVDRAVSSVVPAARPMQIENVTYKFTDIENGKAMLLTADVVNDADSVFDAPKLSMKAFSVGDEILHEATMAPEDLSTEIQPQSRTVYYLRIPHPPEGIERVEVDFADGS